VRSVSNDETSALLGPNQHYNTYDNSDTHSIDSHITILTSNTHSTTQTLDSKRFGSPNNTDDEDDIVARRLNGVSLYTILFGQVYYM
jgi:hemolysin activation/secretion protein